MSGINVDRGQAMDFSKIEEIEILKLLSESVNLIVIVLIVGGLIMLVRSPGLFYTVMMVFLALVIIVFLFIGIYIASDSVKEFIEVGINGETPNYWSDDDS